MARLITVAYHYPSIHIYSVMTSRVSPGSMFRTGESRSLVPGYRLVCTDHVTLCRLFQSSISLRNNNKSISDVTTELCSKMLKDGRKGGGCIGFLRLTSESSAQVS